MPLALREGSEETILHVGSHLFYLVFIENNWNWILNFGLENDEVVDIVILKLIESLDAHKTCQLPPRGTEGLPFSNPTSPK